jgi:RNA polymerase sigma factor (sigma-70 family)
VAAQQGDERAIALLLSGSHPHVQHFARTLCATPDDAEEATQEALIVLYRKIGTLRAAAALASWVYRIVLRECIRRTRALTGRLTGKADAQPSAEDVALVLVETERIIAAIAALPAEQRAVLVLRDIRGLSGAATAQALGLSRAAMKSRLHRGRETLRHLLDSPDETLTVKGQNGM